MRLILIPITVPTPTLQQGRTSSPSSFLPLLFPSSSSPFFLLFFFAVSIFENLWCFVWCMWEPPEWVRLRNTHTHTHTPHHTRTNARTHAHAHTQLIILASKVKCFYNLFLNHLWIEYYVCTYLNCVKYCKNIYLPACVKSYMIK